MPDGRSGPISYRKAQLLARQRAGTLSKNALSNIHQEIVAFADALADRLARMKTIGTADPRFAAATEETIRVMRRAAAKLEAALLKTADLARAASFEDVLEIWQAATVAAAKATGVDMSLLGMVQAPPLTLMGAFENLGAGGISYRTLLKQYVKQGSIEVEAIIRTGLAQGISPDDLARRLRRYVVGADQFKEAFGDLPGFDVEDLRGIAKQQLQTPLAKEALQSHAGRLMRQNADRIAFSEVYNARAEAEVTHYAIDPLTGAVDWRLAPNRGTQISPDICDSLAINNFYGLGPGRYPVDKVPYPPHPYDRCERVPVPREWEEIGTPKPSPARVLTGARARVPARLSRTGVKLTKAQADKVRRDTERMLRRSENSQASKALKKLSKAAAGGPKP